MLGDDAIDLDSTTLAAAAPFDKASGGFVAAEASAHPVVGRDSSTTGALHELVAGDVCDSSSASRRRPSVSGPDPSRRGIWFGYCIVLDLLQPNFETDWS